VAAAAGDFVNFESSHVHPIALSQRGRFLYAVNTPEARLAVFQVRGHGKLRFRGDVAVGLEPVSLAARPGTREVWVANHLSDTVSVIDAARRRLVATLPVGDEPTDIAFAAGRAFVSCSGRDDGVAVFDAATRERIASIELFAEDPRALAVSPDGRLVYAVALRSGNGTTALHPLGLGGPPPPPDPPRDPALGAAPAVGLIVQFDPETGRWLDDAGGDRSGQVHIRLPDEDLFVIDAASTPPALVEAVPRIGTLLFDVAVHPRSGDLWIPNVEARNVVRFEPNLRGHLVETRISIVSAADGNVTSVDLNPHIDYGTTPGPPEEVERSLSQPGHGVFSRDGSRFYVGAFGSETVTVLDGQNAEVRARIRVGGGPSGVALDEKKRRLYVMNRFDNTLSTIDLQTGEAIDVTGVAGPARYDPTPAAIRRGRPFLYDARATSGHGDVACATCHAFGDLDGLAWDLGDPRGEFVPYDQADWVEFAPRRGNRIGFDPMKGPMTTQTLRGLRDMEPFHWRGDRRDFQHFNGAFVSLLGRTAPLSEAQMDAFAAFIMTVVLPPNPYRNLDDTLPSSIPVPDPDAVGAFAVGDPRVGAAIFVNGGRSPLRGPCTRCHAFPAGTLGTLHSGRGRSQDFKIPHLRNLYDKLGRDRTRLGEAGASVEHKQGFGILNDGVIPLGVQLAAFSLQRDEQLDTAAFLRAFGTGTPPCVGQQLTIDFDRRDDGGALARLDALIGTADLGHCDLIARGTLGQRRAGFQYEPGLRRFAADTARTAPMTARELLDALGRADVLTWTAVPSGSGRRLGLDRDRDGCLDGDERQHGSDPADPGFALPDQDGDGAPDRCIALRSGS
jgi:YVTN family beta-propeller protein